MSKLSVSCPSCAKRYGVPEEHAGKKFKCKDCGATISIPAAAAEAEPEEPAAFDEEEPAPPKRKKSTTHRRPARRRPAPTTRRHGTRGRSEEAEEAPARAGHRRGGARRPTGGGRSTRGRRGAHAQDDEYGGREYGGKQQPNKNLLILSAVACLVLLVALIVIFAIPRNSGTITKKKKRAVAAKTENEFVPPKIVVNPEDEDPGFGVSDRGRSKEPESAPEPVAAAAKKSEKKPEKKPKKAEPKKPSLPPIPRAKIRKLDHLESTAAEVRTQINEAIDIVKDPWSGAAGNRKRRALVKFGKAAVPPLLSAMVDLDFSQEDARSTMTPLTEILQEITKTPNSYICRVGMMGSDEANAHMCKYFRALWFEWYDGRIGRRYMEE